MTINLTEKDGNGYGDGDGFGDGDWDGVYLYLDGDGYGYGYGYGNRNGNGGMVAELEKKETNKPTSQKGLHWKHPVGLARELGLVISRPFWLGFKK